MLKATRALHRDFDEPRVSFANIPSEIHLVVRIAILPDAADAQTEPHKDDIG